MGMDYTVAHARLFKRGENILHLGNRRVPPIQLKSPISLYNKYKELGDKNGKNCC